MSCYFIATSARDVSAPRHFKVLASELASRRHNVIVLVDERRVDVESADTNPAVLTWPSRRPTHLKDARFLRRLLVQHRPSCVIANFGSTNLMLLVSAFERVPYRVCWYHTLSEQVDIDAGRSPTALRLLRFRRRLVYRAATQIVPVSYAADRDVRRTFGVPPEKITVFHNAIADPLSNGVRPGAGLGSRHVLCVGRMYPTKGQDVLIRALARLQSAVPDWRVKFVGDGPSRPAFENLARAVGVADRCEFLGQQPSARVMELMAGAEATVVPSLIDNCPMVVIESLAVGTPVIASAVGGITEMVTDGSDGLLVPPRDDEALAGALRRTLCEPELAAEMRLNARARFLSQFEQRSRISVQVDWLESMTGDRAPSLADPGHAGTIQTVQMPRS
jgi:glycosyltransferase involved in cell wall biosynthesis